MPIKLGASDVTLRLGSAEVDAYLGTESLTFSPDSIADLAGWWDASVASSLFQVSDGTTAVTATDDPVAYWGDQSGNGRHLTQAVTNNRPFYKPGTINGKPTLSFDGSNDTLSASFTLSQPCQYFLVFKFNVGYSTGGPRVLDGVDALASFWRTNTNEVRMNAGGSDRLTAAAPLTPQSPESFAVWDIEWNGLSSAFRAAGIRQDTGSGTGTNAPGGIRLAVFQNGFSSPGNVSFAEILIYSRVLSAAEATKVRAYLGTKYNLPYA